MELPRHRHAIVRPHSLLFLRRSPEPPRSLDHFRREVNAHVSIAPGGGEEGHGGAIAAAHIQHGKSRRRRRRRHSACTPAAPSSPLPPGPSSATAPLHADAMRRNFSRTAGLPPPAAFFFFFAAAADPFLPPPPCSAFRKDATLSHVSSTSFSRAAVGTPAASGASPAPAFCRCCALSSCSAANSVASLSCGPRCSSGSASAAPRPCPPPPLRAAPPPPRPRIPAVCSHPTSQSRRPCSERGPLCCRPSSSSPSARVTVYVTCWPFGAKKASP